MFNKLVDVIKEVFWLKKTVKKRKSKVAKKVIAKKRPIPSRKIKRPVVKAARPVKPTPVKIPKVKLVKVPKVKLPIIDPHLVQVGEITQYFERIKVAVVHVKEGSVIIGDKIHIIGVKTKVMQKVWSMQVDRQDVKVAQKGQEIGLKIDKAVEIGDKVYK